MVNMRKTRASDEGEIDSGIDQRQGIRSGTDLASRRDGLGRSRICGGEESDERGFRLLMRRVGHRHECCC